MADDNTPPHGTLRVTLVKLTDEQVAKIQHDAAVQRAKQLLTILKISGVDGVEIINDIDLVVHGAPIGRSYTTGTEQVLDVLRRIK